MSLIAPTLTLVVGAVLGAWLTRRNEKKRAAADRLLLDTLSDVVDAIAAVAGGGGCDALQRYASATARLALHASPEVVAAFRHFQDDATTATADGPCTVPGGSRCRTPRAWRQGGSRRRPRGAAVGNQTAPFARESEHP